MRGERDDERMCKNSQSLVAPVLVQHVGGHQRIPLQVRTEAKQELRGGRKHPDGKARAERGSGVDPGCARNHLAEQRHWGSRALCEEQQSAGGQDAEHKTVVFVEEQGGGVGAC